MAERCKLMKPDRVYSGEGEIGLAPFTKVHTDSQIGIGPEIGSKVGGSKRFAKVRVLVQIRKGSKVEGLETLKGSNAEAREIRKGSNVDGARTSSKGLEIDGARKGSNMSERLWIRKSIRLES